MSILLLILKIIGIILACVFGLFLLILCMILFVPVRYKVSGNYDDVAFVKAKVSYLLHIICIQIIYDSELKMALRILGIPFSLNKKRKNSDSTKVASEVKSDSSDIPNAKDAVANITESSSEVHLPENDNTDAGENKQPKVVNADANANNDTIEDKSGGDSQEATSKKIDAKPQKGENALDKLKGFLDILNAEETKEAFKVCKKRIGKLFRAILPRKLKINCTYGLNNPYYTGIVMSAYNVFYIYFSKVINIYPVYDDVTIKVNGCFKGRIIPVVVLWQGIAVILNKNCRAFYKRIRNM